MNPVITPASPSGSMRLITRGGWAATSEVSEEDLKAKVLKLRHPKK